MSGTRVSEVLRRHVANGRAVKDRVLVHYSVEKLRPQHARRPSGRHDAVARRLPGAT
jgi:hypothetical protein